MSKKIYTKDDPEYWETLGEILKGDKVSDEKPKKEETKALTISEQADQDVKWENFLKTIEGQFSTIIEQMGQMLVQCYFTKSHIQYVCNSEREARSTFKFFVDFLQWVPAPGLRRAVGNEKGQFIEFKNGSVIIFKVDPMETEEHSGNLN